MLNDFDRPLNPRGKQDAPDMAQRLLKRGVTIDCFVSSPAKRAKKTAALFIREFKRDELEIVFKSELYHAPPEVFADVITHADDRYNSLAVFAHNPGITLFVNMLTDVRLDNMPTCAVFAVQAYTQHWKDFMKARKEFLFFEYPKG